MGVFVNKDAGQILQTKILICPGCHRSMLPGDRGWYCDIIGHHTGFDSDELAARALSLKSGENLMESMRRVKRHRAAVAGKSREQVAAMIAEATEAAAG